MVKILIQVDSREKPKAIEKIMSYFSEKGIETVPQKLDVGDYMNLDNPKVIVDRKQSLGELCTNLCSADKSRFWREVRLAKELGYKLIILCEHSNRVKSIEDVADWKSKYTRVSGRDLMEKIYQCHIAYGVEFLFCDKQHTGQRIVELLRI